MTTPRALGGRQGGESIRAGAAGKPLRRATDGGPSRKLAPDPSVRRLSPREQEVVQLMADGLKDVIIAKRLGLARSTVVNYIRHATWRLGLASRAELVAWVQARRPNDPSESRLRRVADT